MAVIAFLLGRPGSGKSTAFRHIEQYVEKKYPDWSTIRFQDYEILQEMFRVDRLFESDPRRRKFKAIDHGGFDVRDFSVLDTALKELEKLARRRYSPTRDEFIIIEFARDDYSKALEKFSSTFLEHAYFLFIDADIETCIQRVHERVTNPKATTDDHFVSPEILKSYYSKQVMSLRLERGDTIDKQRVKAIHSTALEQDFAKQVCKFIDSVYTSELNAKTSARKVYTRLFEKVPMLVSHVTVGKPRELNSTTALNRVVYPFRRRTDV